MERVERNGRIFKVIPEGRRVICETQGYNLSKEWETFEKGIKAILKEAAKQCGINLCESYIATSWCDEKDNFDEHTGIEIANEKADLARHEYAMEYYEKLSAFLLKAIYECDALAYHHSEKAQKIYNDMVRTYGWDNGITEKE